MSILKFVKEVNAALEDPNLGLVDTDLIRGAYVSKCLYLVATDKPGKIEQICMGIILSPVKINYISLVASSTVLNIAHYKRVGLTEGIKQDTIAGLLYAGYVLIKEVSKQ